MKNVQISFDETLLESVDRYAATARLSRSAIVRQALKRWLGEKQIQEFENEWIAKLKEKADSTEESETWIKTEQWGDE
ncbi:MAG: CopG family transcriptional regulator [Desulfobacterales bacterium]|uniref:CopG family transcriptional regulator n=1 Tax=Candidatus Desulfatibia profunda TaxID=2841695 RepID=A0A8J6NZ47_9BACT|nr:CopG family transcriptional regulator [Candidatus Desulfatibia profunda]MBL7179970.1 CopG family transcriptional regulator [Desulfobacterales bacterium]MBU0697983.1 ribbon-helix-helix domain-containing protein [Pseudomonadota bacterium]